MNRESALNARKRLRAEPQPTKLPSRYRSLSLKLFVAQKLKRNDVSPANAIGFSRTGLGWQVTPAFFHTLSCRDDPSGLTPAKGLPKQIFRMQPCVTRWTARLKSATT
jgi:hypothetical protein